MQAECLPQVRGNQASLKMALVDAHIQADQKETSLPIRGACVHSSSV